MDKQERGRLQSDLASEREALLATVLGIHRAALAQPTRNPDWTVRDVLAHVLASDADLISVAEAARDATGPIPMPGLEQHQREMGRWAQARPEDFSRELRERGDGWRQLLADLSDEAWELLVLGDWWPQDAMAGSPSDTTEAAAGTRPLADVVADWKGHDTQHAEDVRLALDGAS